MKACTAQTNQRALMKHFSAFLSCLALLSALRAQTTTNPPTNRTSDGDWAALTTLTTPVQPVKASGQPSKTPTQVSLERQQRALQARQAAVAAKDFYTRHPTHVNAPVAKKLEALQALQAVTDGDPAYEVSAGQIASSYRANPGIPAADRFEVAALAERVAARAQLGGKVFGNSPAELEKIANKLHVEFGDIPEAYFFSASVARTADMETSDRMAGKILKSAAAPAEARAEAQSIQDRKRMVGTLLNVQLRTIEAKTVDLAQQAGKLTILYIWSSAAGSEAMAGLLPIKKSLPVDAQVIYVSLGASGEQVKALESNRPIPGPICIGGATTAGPLAAQLKVRHTPYVYILNRAGKLHGFGPAASLPALLATAAP